MSKLLDKPEILFCEDDRCCPSYAKIKNNYHGEVKLRRYPKKLTMNQMRRELYVDTCEIADDINYYGKYKNNSCLKERNKILHNLFYNKKNVSLYELTDENGPYKGFIRFNSTPSYFDKVKVNNARYVYEFDYSKCFVGET